MTIHLFGKPIAATNLVCALLLATLVSAQQQPGDSAHNWLNGKWRGPAPGGGLIVVDIKVIEGDQIAGKGRLEPRSSYEPVVSGKVNGDKVTLILTNTRSGNIARFDLTRSGEQLSGNRKGEGVVFEKKP